MRKPTFRAVSLIVCVSMMLSMVPWSPNVGLAEGVPEEADDQVASVPVDVAEDALSFHHYLSAPPTSPIVVDAHRTVAEQNAHPEPTPVAVEAALPAGTVKEVTLERYTAYLPLLEKTSSLQALPKSPTDSTVWIDNIWVDSNNNLYTRITGATGRYYRMYVRRVGKSWGDSGRDYYQIYLNTTSEDYWIVGDVNANTVYCVEIRSNDNSVQHDIASYRTGSGSKPYTGDIYLDGDCPVDYNYPRVRLVGSSSSLDISPANPTAGENVQASFGTICNDGAVTADLSDTYVKVDTNENWSSVNAGSLICGECSAVNYSQSRSFTDGSKTATAGYDSGGWQAFGTRDGALNEQIFSVLTPADVKIKNGTSLSLNPSEISLGQNAIAQFTVHNYGQVAITERFRAAIYDSTGNSYIATFPETADQTLAGGEEYSYSQSYNFTDGGIYWIKAQHYTGSNWVDLAGEGRFAFRVKVPPPPSDAKVKGTPPACGFAGEPVNTSTGNYFYDFTDLSDPTPGLPLATTRWYNALDADEAIGPFGHGTSWTYNMTVTLRSDKSALVRLPDGHMAYFLGEMDPDDPTNLDGLYAGQDRDTGSMLERTGDTAVLTTPDQTSYHFNAAGRLARVTHPTPATITVAYSGTQPVQLVHSAGVTHTLIYSGSLITGISSSSGRAVTYTYTLSDDLSMVTRPDGSTYTYFYDENHRLTEARTPNGHAFVRNVYDDQGRVIRQYDQTGEESTFTYGDAITQTRHFTDALGNVITHTYDTNHFLVQEVDALGHTTVYTRDADGNVLVRRDKKGNLWHYAYDDQGNMLSETNPLNNTWTYTYDAHNNRTSKTNPLGNTWEYEYDANERLILTRDPLGHTHAYDYDDQGNLIWERDENSAETWYDYNKLGLQTAITDALGNVTHMAYDAFGNQTVYTDANGNAAHFVYDDLNRLTKSIDPMGNVITFTYDAMGNLLTESDGMGNLKHYVYDEYDRIIAETDFEGHTTRYAYDSLGRKTVITDALGNTTVMTYNAAGQLAARQGKDGAVTRYGYDAMGRMISETDALSRTTEYVYDTAGRQVEVRRPCDVCLGGMAVSQTRYDAAGRVIEEIDPRGATTQYGYDALGRQAVMTDTYGYTQTTTYDPTGRVIQDVDQVGAVTSYQYDALGQLITTTNALGYQSVKRYDAVGRHIFRMNARGYTTSYTYDANDQLIATTDALGNVTRNTYDAAGRLLSTTDPLSRTTMYTYDANGNRLTETDPRGHTTTYLYDALGRTIEVIEPTSCCGGGSRTVAYDAAGRVISETNALGHTTIYTYDVVGRSIAERSPLGYTTVYTYDVADNRIARQDRTGAVWRYEYDANGNQIRQIDPVPAVVGIGNVHTTEYDLLNRAIRETDPLGATTERDYGPAGRVVRSTDARGATTRLAYDLLGRTVQETSPLGYTTVYTYDANGNTIAVQDRRSFVTTYIYDALDRQIAQTDPAGNLSHTVYDAAGQVIADVDYNGHTTQYAYDTAGNQIAITDALSNTTVTEYDELNRPIAMTDPLSRTVHMAYDAAGRVISRTLPNGGVAAYTYDAEGREIAFTDPLGYVWRTEYDAAGRPIRETDPLGRSQITTYDALGRAVAVTDALSRTTSYAYDPVGRLSAVVGPEGTTQRYTYDAAGNILTERDGNGHITRYEYDLEGRQLRKTNALGKRWRYRYDAAGNMAATLLPSGAEITQSYDALGRLIRKAQEGSQVVALGYDANGNRTVMTDTLGVTAYVYDALNQLVASTDPAGRTVQYTYDAAGQRVGLTYPDNTTAHYAYDATGELAQITAPDGGVTVYERDALGRETHITQANGVEVDFTYDAVGNLLTKTQRDADGVVFARHTYTVDDVNLRTQEIEQLGQSVVTTTYTYDALERLVDSVASDGTETYYAFDDAGNRTAMWGVREREGITETYRVDYAYNAANQLWRATDSATGETTYAYDADGRRIMERSFERWADYDYDAEGRLIAAQVQQWEGGEWVIKDGITEQYVYDGTGRRVRKNTISVALESVVSRREYRYDDIQVWDVLQTYDVAATTTEARYLYDEAFHKLAYWEGDEAGYLQNDALGSVLGATEADGHGPNDLMDYGDYGELESSEDALPTGDGYTGYEYDAYTGLSYARNRYYDAKTGMFLTVDPYPKDYIDLLDLNRYGYTQANPINRIDPLGLFSLRSIVSKVKETVTRSVQRVSRSIRRAVSKTVRLVKPASREHSLAKRVVNAVRRSAKTSVSTKHTGAIWLGRAPLNCGKKPTASIVGTVINEKTGSPISLAKVAVSRFQVLSCSYNCNWTYTRKDGSYVISNLTVLDGFYGNSTTKYNILVTARGYVAQSGSVNVKGGKTTRYSPALQPFDNDYQIRRLECDDKMDDYINNCKDNCNDKGWAWEFIGAIGGGAIGAFGGPWGAAAGGGIGYLVGKVPTAMIQNKCKDKCEEEGSRIYSECMK